MAHGMPPLGYTTLSSPLSTPALSNASLRPLPCRHATPPGMTSHQNVLVTLHFWIMKQTKLKICNQLKHRLEEFVCTTITFHARFGLSIGDSLTRFTSTLQNPLTFLSSLHNRGATEGVPKSKQNHTRIGTGSRQPATQSPVSLTRSFLSSTSAAAATPHDRGG
jgi:hypothetical protein